MKKTRKILILFLIIISFISITFATEIENEVANTVVQPEPEGNTNTDSNPGTNTTTEPVEPTTPDPVETTTDPTEDPTDPVETTTPNPENTDTDPVEQKPVNLGGQTQTNDNNNNNYTETVKSTNNYLKSLTVDKEGLNPEFDKNTDIYYIIVPLDVENLSINAIPEDSKAKVSVSGNRSLTEGENIVTITVTAETGNWRVYTINVTKTDDLVLANATLKELTIKGFDIEFDPNKYKYTVEIGEKQYNLDITALTENEKATLAIEGNENFKNGENRIVIKVIAEDGTTQKEYIIYAIKDFSKVEIEKTNSATKLIIIIVCSALFVTCFIIFITKLTRK